MKKFLAKLFRRFNGNAMLDPDDYPLDPADLEMIVDGALQDCGKPPLKRTPQEGIADMQARISRLNNQKIQLLNAPDIRMEEIILQEVRTLNTELQEARDRLKEYQTQLEGLN